MQEYLLRVKHADRPDVWVGRRYADFVELHKRIRLELPGKVLTPLPRKNKGSSLLPSGDDDADSVSSVSTQDVDDSGGGGLRSYLLGHKRNASTPSVRSSRSPRASVESSPYREPLMLYQEDQRVSLRAFLRTFLQNESIAHSRAMAEFLTAKPIQLNDEEREDAQRREEMDEKRIEEQHRFYEIARQRAAELDVHMEKFRREIVEQSASVCHCSSLR